LTGSLCEHVESPPRLAFQYRAAIRSARSSRALEIVHAYEEAVDILCNYQPLKPSRIELDHKAGEGYAATEVPRNLIYPRYAVDTDRRKSSVLCPR
jgi:coenzyme F420-reducing hydrogenase alpha subunit